MSDEIPYAQPFQWTQEQPRGNASRTLRKRKFVGSGFALLRKEALSSESNMGNVAKNILMNLFHQHGIELDGELESDAQKFKGIGLSDGSLNAIKSKKQSNNESENDDSRKKGSLDKSIFVALLKAVTEAGSGPVSTRQILGKVCLLLQPGTLPGIMDSRDMVLSTLHFLSSRCEAKSEYLFHLPLIRPLQAYGDLERRNYEKVGNWNLEDIKERLLRMEELFLSSPSSWGWQKRESLSLRLSEADEESFFMTGTVPLCATASARKNKTEGVKKRKVAIKKNKIDSLDDVVEASIDDAETNDEPVVEATILDDPF